LSFVVTRAVLVGLAEVAESDGAVYCRNDVGESNIGWGLGKNVAAADASLGTH
jgi:hypothetical protein